MSPLSPTTNHFTPPVQPVDILNGARQPKFVGFQTTTTNNEKQTPSTVATRVARADSDSSSSSNNSSTPRKARFAEATSVYSPARGPDEFRSPFADPPKMSEAQHKPSDVGFGYISNTDHDNGPVEQHATVPVSYGPGGQPLKSALKTPGTAARLINPLSPTFQEEEALEKEEEKTEIEQARDLVSKI